MLPFQHPRTCVCLPSASVPLGEKSAPADGFDACSNLLEQMTHFSTVTGGGSFLEREVTLCFLGYCFLCGPRKVETVTWRSHAGVLLQVPPPPPAINNVAGLAWSNGIVHGEGSFAVETSALNVCRGLLPSCGRMAAHLHTCGDSRGALGLSSHVDSVPSLSSLSSSGGENDGEDFGHNWTAPNQDLILKLVAQIEYYFSDENLEKDAFLLKHVRRNKMGYVSVKLLTSFKKVSLGSSRYAALVGFCFPFLESVFAQSAY